MRVLHVTGCYLPATEWGGVVTAVAGLARASAAAGIGCEIFTTTQRSSPALPPIEPGTRMLDGLQVSWFKSIHGGGRGFVAPGMLSALRRRVRDFDLVHIHMLWTFPGIAAAHACRRAGVPYLLSPHGALDPHALTQRALEKKIFLLLGERRSLERAALLQFATGAERESTPEWVRALPAALVPNVVEVPGKASPAAGHEVLMIGRIHAIKGFDVLVPAMKQVVAQEPRARLVVAGPDEGGYRAQVEAMIAAHGLGEAVRFAGLVGAEERAELFAGAALLAAPSYQENFGMAVVEAMAAGLPVVVSDKMNLAGELAAAGAGLMTPLESSALAEAILSLLRDPARRQQLGTAGRGFVLERYSAAAVGEKLRRLYETVAARP